MPTLNGREFSKSDLPANKLLSILSICNKFIGHLSVFFEISLRFYIDVFFNRKFKDYRD